VLHVIPTADHKTIADFRKDNGAGIKRVCGQFIELCRQMGLLTISSVAIDGSKFKAVNNRDKKQGGAAPRAVGGEAPRQEPHAMRQRRETVEHPFGTLKMRMGATHFLMKRLPKVATEMALHVLAYNLTRVMNIVGIQPLMAAIRA
jgi:transposase